MIVMKKIMLLFKIIYSQECHKIVLIHMYCQGNVQEIVHIGKKVIKLRNIVLPEVKVVTLKQLT